MIKEILVALIIIVIWVTVQVVVDMQSPCSNFAPNDIAGNCTQEIEE